jgi:undecaprenyl-diphosphatase
MLMAACLVVLVHPRARRVRRVVVWTLAVVLVLLTGVDRIALGVHYLSDVLAGWVVALATVTATTVAFATWRRSEGLPATSTDEGLDPDPDHPPIRSDAPRRGRPWARPLGRLAGQLVLRWVVVLAVLVAVGMLVTTVAESVWPFTVEDGVDRALAAGRTPTRNTLTVFMSGLGNTSTIVPLCLLAAVVLRLVLHRWRESLLVGAVTLGQSVVFVLTTLAIDRERPGVPHLDDSPPTSSFPSGHTSASIALYSSLAVVAHRRIRNPWVRRPVMVLLLCLPGLVATGRLYRGMHHPSDVVAALLNAGLLLLLTDRLLRTTPLPDDGAVPPSGVAALRPGAADGAPSDPDHPTREVLV